MKAWGGGADNFDVAHLTLRNASAASSSSLASYLSESAALEQSYRRLRDRLHIGAVGEVIDAASSFRGDSSEAPLEIQAVTLLLA
jgi:hypothetical protein